MEATVKFYTDSARGGVLADVVIDLPYYGLIGRCKITRSQTGSKHVSWPRESPGDGESDRGSRTWLTPVRDGTAEWDSWIMDRYEDFVNR